MGLGGLLCGNPGGAGAHLRRCVLSLGCKSSWSHRQGREQGPHLASLSSHFRKPISVCLCLGPYSITCSKATDQETGALFTKWHLPICLNQSPVSIPGPALGALLPPRLLYPRPQGELLPQGQSFQESEAPGAKLLMPWEHRWTWDGLWSCWTAEG